MCSIVATSENALVRLAIASDARCWHDEAAGTRVIAKEQFAERLAEAVAETADADAGRTEARMFKLDSDASTLVSANGGRVTGDLNDEVIRCYDGIWDIYLKRPFAAPALAVYTLVLPMATYWHEVVRQRDEAECLLRCLPTHILLATYAPVVDEGVALLERWETYRRGNILDGTFGSRLRSTLFQPGWRPVAD